MADRSIDSHAGPGEARPGQVRETRRRVIQGTVAVAGGLAAASYVAPTLRALGIPAALAMSGSSPPPTQQGCSPGYWKNHPQNWVGYSPSQTLGSVFTIPSSLNTMSSLTLDTLLDALSSGGGSTLSDKALLLLHQAVAALLNITAGLNYPTYTSTAALIGAVNSALASLDATTIDNLQGTLDTDNNLAC
ncbi:MAG: hypothetical protein ACRDIY_02190, partial [Chloroflexota bacterium]